MNIENMSGTIETDASEINSLLDRIADNIAQLAETDPSVVARFNEQFPDGQGPFSLSIDSFDNGTIRVKVEPSRGLREFVKRERQSA